MEKENRPDWKACNGNNDAQDERQRYSKNQAVRLEKEFSINRYPSRQEFRTLSKTMKITERKIQVWFQNRRARQRRIDRKASGIPQNPLPNMFYRLSTNAANGNSILGLRKSKLENAPTTSKPTGSYRKTSNSKMQRIGSYRRTSISKTRRIASYRKTSTSTTMQRTGSHRKTSTSTTMQRTGSHRSTSNSNLPAAADQRRRSIRGLSDVHDEDLATLMQRIDWEATALDDDVFTDDLEQFL